MTNQEVLIQEVQDEISAEMPERLRVIETAQEKDKEIQSRMERGEIGIRDRKSTRLNSSHQ